MQGRQPMRSSGDSYGRSNPQQRLYSSDGAASLRATPGGAVSRPAQHTPHAAHYAQTPTSAAMPHTRFDRSVGGATPASTPDPETVRLAKRKRELAKEIEEIDTLVVKSKADATRTRRRLEKARQLLAQGDVVAACDRVNVDVVAEVLNENRERAKAAGGTGEALTHEEVVSGAGRRSVRPPRSFEFYEESKRQHMLLAPRVVEAVRKRRRTTHEKKVALAAEWKRQFEKWTEQRRTLPEPGAGEASASLRPGSFDDLPGMTFTSSGRVVRLLDDIRTERQTISVMSSVTADEQAARFRYIRTATDAQEQVLDEQERRAQYHDETGLVRDAKAAWRARLRARPWSDHEKTIFLKKYLRYPKNFAKIASFLSQRSTQDVVEFFYRNKYKFGLKQLLQRHRTATRSAPGKERRPGDFSHLMPQQQQQQQQQQQKGSLSSGNGAARPT